MRKSPAIAIVAAAALYAGDLLACGTGGGFGIRITRRLTTIDRLDRAPPASIEKAPDKPAVPAAPAGAEADGSVVYEFADSILSAGGFGPCDATIRLRPRPVRPTAVQLRLNFIGELLRDIESL